MKNEHITIILRPCDHCRHMLRSCHVVITQPDAIVVHQSTINIADVASGTHEVGKILIATGKRQRNPWVPVGMHVGGVHMVNRYLEESSDGSVVTPCVDRATGT